MELEIQAPKGMGSRRDGEAFEFCKGCAYAVANFRPTKYLAPKQEDESLCLIS